MSHSRFLCWSVFSAALLIAPWASAQQVKLTTPFHRLNDSYYENYGIGWGFNKGNFNFSTGPFTSAPPPFGRYDPSTDATFGFGRAGGGGSGFFNFRAGQGNSRSHVMEAPSVVIHNGQQGFFSDTSQRPLVTGVVPVVGTGQGPRLPQYGPSSPAAYENTLRQNALRRAQYEQAAQLFKQQQRERERQEEAWDRASRVKAQAQGADAPLVLGGKREKSSTQQRSTAFSGSSASSTANRGDISVAEIRRRQALESLAVDQEIQSRLDRAQEAEDAGKFGVAMEFRGKVGGSQRGGSSLVQHHMFRQLATDARAPNIAGLMQCV